MLYVDQPEETPAAPTFRPGEIPPEVVDRIDRLVRRFGHAMADSVEGTGDFTFGTSSQEIGEYGDIVDTFLRAGAGYHQVEDLVLQAIERNASNFDSALQRNLAHRITEFLRHQANAGRREVIEIEQETAANISG